jgi:hypothetical protein
MIEKVNLMSFQPFHPNTSRARVSLELELELETSFNSNPAEVSNRAKVCFLMLVFAFNHQISYIFQGFKKISGLNCP